MHIIFTYISIYCYTTLYYIQFSFFFLRKKNICWLVMHVLNKYFFSLISFGIVYLYLLSNTFFSLYFKIITHLFFYNTPSYCSISRKQLINISIQTKCMNLWYIGPSISDRKFWAYLLLFGRRINGLWYANNSNFLSNIDTKNCLIQNCHHLLMYITCGSCHV